MSDDEPDGAADGPAPDDAAPDPETPEPHEPASGDDAPLSDLAERMSRQRRDRSDVDSAEPAPDIEPELSEGPPPEPDDDPFDRMSVGEIDEEELWSSLGSDDAGVGVGAAPDAGSLGGVEPASGVESVDGAGPETREHVVPKDKYCQSCPYLDDPPELACTHEGTEIVEVVDSERFRVRNCPMVENGVEPKK